MKPLNTSRKVCGAVEHVVEAFEHVEEAVDVEGIGAAGIAGAAADGAEGCRIACFPCSTA